MKLRIQPIRSLFPAMICGLLCFAFLVIVPAAAFTADSLNISVGTNGDATAVFQFTLDGVIENAIPQSMLEDQLAKGLATSSSPPQIISFDKSEATLLLNGFATTTNVPTGTEYQTSTMDFSKAQIALQNSAVRYGHICRFFAEDNHSDLPGRIFPPVFFIIIPAKH